MKIKGEIEKSTINVALIRENDNYCEQKIFTQINNYCELEGVCIKGLSSFLSLFFFYVFNFGEVKDGFES